MFPRVMDNFKFAYIDFVQLDHVTKFFYPVHRADRPQEKLAGRCVFSKLDLRSAYWQFPMEEKYIEKQHFVKGLAMDLVNFWSCLMS